ncbi:NUMOD4 domain-containing protein [bacterium]|nr:NUMOD4 domain-containing protein [bacterium]
MKREVWKDVEGYEGTYQVSNLGNVKSLDRNVIYKDGKTVPYKGETKSKVIDKYGYEYVGLYLNQKHKQGMIHRLVAKAFIPNINNKPQINHIDGNKLNNKTENLEWVTNRENIDHAVKTGLLDKVTGENHYKSKLTNKDVLVIRKRVENGETYQTIANDYGVVKSTIGFLINGKTWSRV